MGKDDKKNEETPTPPKLVKRRENKKSSFQLGRTIGERREKLETANERALARKKDKKKKALRVILTIAGFICLVVLLIILFKNLVANNNVNPDENTENMTDVIYEPTVQIVDTGLSGGKITTRMKEYVGRAEKDFRDLGYHPTKVVIPTGLIREVDFYLEGKPGYIKLTIDRSSAVSVEDADRMLRYLSNNGIEEFEYIDVRIDGKAYWK